MKLIDLRRDYADVADMAGLDPKSLRYKGALNRLYETLLHSGAFDDGSCEAKQWKKARTFLTAASILLIAAGALAETANLPKNIVHPVCLIPVALMGAALIAENTRFLLYAQRQLLDALRRLTVRHQALSEKEKDAVLSALCAHPAYPRKRPGAVCGCIRCEALFPARDAAALCKPVCPRCGAEEKYLVYLDEGANAAQKTLALLKNLFDEEN